MAHFHIENLTFSYPGAAVPTMDGVSLDIQKGEFLLLCGPSGSGKTTLLRQMKPALSPYGQRDGAIFFDGKPIGELTAREQAEKIGFVMQDPQEQIVTDKVWHELAFGLENLGCDPAVMRLRVAEMASFFGIQDWFHREVAELSGGQKQLLNLASVMAMQPEVLILDEPTSQLDPISAGDFLNTLKKINRELGTTIIYVTHDQVEALTMSTKIALFRKGELVQVAPPLELYDNPVNLYTADFIGNPSINFVKGTATVDASGMVTESSVGQISFDRADMTPDAPQSGKIDVTLGIRPEQLSITRTPDDLHRIEGHVYSGMPAGSETLATVRVGSDLLTVKELGSTHYNSDETVYLGFNPKKINVFDSTTENLIKYCV